jgi:hypothetical protein
LGKIVAYNLKKVGWSLGYVSAIDSNGRTIWIAEAHRDNGKRFVAHADEKTDGVSQTRIATSDQREGFLGKGTKMAHSPCFAETQLETVFLRELRDLCFPVFFV